MASASTYQVKPGDTLSAIARQLGVKQGDITGYRSNDPNRIFAGETLQVGGGSTPGGSGTTGSGTTGGSDYTSALSKILGVDTAAPVDYSATIKTAKENKQKAFDELQGFKTKRYNEEYSSRGLDKTFKELGALDDEIAAAKKARDEGIAQSQKNPYASAATLSGDAGKIRTAENDKINTLIEQRNAKASLYNDALTELDRLVGNEASDKQLAYTYWQNEENNASKLQSSVQDALIKELQDQEQYAREDARNKILDDQWAQQLKVALINAQKGGSSGSADLQLVTDLLGNPISSFNRRTGTVTPIPSTGTPTGLPAGINSATLPSGVTINAPKSSGGGILGWLKSKIGW